MTPVTKKTRDWFDKRYSWENIYHSPVRTTPVMIRLYELAEKQSKVLEEIRDLLKEG